jgi:predicted cation transporter
VAAIRLAIPEEPVAEVVAGLLAILVIVLVLPMVSKRVEENLEPFFLAMGITGFALILWAGIVPDVKTAWKIVETAARTPVSIAGLPIGITQVVLIAGLFFYFYRERIKQWLEALMGRVGLPSFIFILVLVLGLSSSVISVIVAAVILSEVLAFLPIPRQLKARLAVIACYALGLGAALTPIGEPLSTIAVSKLSGPPYYAGFTFLLDLLGIYIVPGVIATAALSAWVAARWRSSLTPRELGHDRVEVVGAVEVEEETLRTVVWRAIKVYMFVAALELLGTSFLPLVEWYFTKIPPYVLYWVNMVSAVLDNATLTAAEIGPQLTLSQIKSALMALLVSGGMLIPGNIPNIVTAGRLRITSKEWARIGVPLGIVMLSAYFIILLPEMLG